MDLNNFGIMNSLMTIIDSQANDNDKAIARYIVSNARCIDSIGVQELINKAFVSRSAIRRFCNKLGYSSWNDLKVNFNCNVFPSDLQYRDFSAPFDEYRRDLTSNIAKIFLDVESTVTKAKLIYLSRLIHEHEDVIFVCPSNTASALLRFQQEMLYGGKIINLMLDAYTNRPPSDGKSSTLTVSVSVMGGFAEAIDPWLNRQPGRKALITTSGDLSCRNSYHDLFNISGAAHNRDVLGAYAKYGIPYFFDLLSANYLSLYPYQQADREDTKGLS